MARGTGPLLVFFGHHRCGTTSLTSLVRTMARALGRTFAETSSRHDAKSVRRLVDAERPQVLAIRNATPEAALALPPHCGFHVIRDPRDVVVSAYYSHRYSHPVTEDWPDLVALRQRYESVSVDEGLHLEIEFESGTFDSMRRWPASAEVLELRLEDVMADPVGRVMEIGNHLGVVDDRALGGRQAVRYLTDRIARRLGRESRIPRDAWLGIAWDHRFEAVAGRSRGDEDVRSHFRRGTPGSWREAFTPAHRRAFVERYPGLLEHLGYEDGPDWVEAP